MAEANISSDANIAVPEYVSILCDGSVVDNIISEFGVDVVIRSVSKEFDATEAYDDPTESNTDYRTRAFVNSYTLDDEEVKEGIFKAGDVVLNFKSTDESYLKTGYLVWFDNVWWEIRRITYDYSGSRKFLIRCVISKSKNEFQQQS